MYARHKTLLQALDEIAPSISLAVRAGDLNFANYSEMSPNVAALLVAMAISSRTDVAIAEDMVNEYKSLTR